MSDSSAGGNERCQICNVNRPASQLVDEEWMWAPGHFAPGPICEWHMERADPNFFNTYSTDNER